MKLIAGILVIMALTLMASPVLACDSKDTVKGKIHYLKNGVEREAHFKVKIERDGGAVNGKIQYNDDWGNHIRADATHFKLDGRYGYFAGPITDTDNPDYEGKWVSVAVFDGGRGSQDFIWGKVTSMEEAVQNVENEVTPGNMGTVFRGDIRIKMGS